LNSTAHEARALAVRVNKYNLLILLGIHGTKRRQAFEFRFSWFNNKWTFH